MDRTLHTKLTLPKHPDLLHEINEASISIKVYHTAEWRTDEDRDNLIAAQKMHPEPTWENVIDLLKKCYTAINEQREDPRNY